jgi:CRP-like cAMP-binding protein
MNSLLQALPPEELEQFRANGREVELAVNNVLHEAGSVLDHVYFPHGGLISFLVAMRNSSVVEAGFVGPEGAVGSIYSAPARTSLTRATVVAGGSALRISLDQFEHFMDQSKTFRHLIGQNNNRIAERGQQLAACNLLHQLESRVCRWLLQVFDNGENPHVVITQENLAEMLGVNRARLNEALKTLQKIDAIAPTQRGGLTIVDVKSISERVCDCYLAMRVSKSN